MSEKPFWEGKTCEEMANLHVKVTFEDGTVVTGITNSFGDIDDVIPLSLVSGNDEFVPYSYVESIELVDDPEYERIDNIEDVRVGDVYVAADGNKYTIISLTQSNLYPLRVMICKGTDYALPRDCFSHALRPKPKLPNHDGLWLDKDNAIWQVYDHQAVPVYDDADEWRLQREVFLVSQLGKYAPFRPAKAVEA